jgi:ubiquinone biosynthesis protein UbiJ
MAINDTLPLALLEQGLNYRLRGSPAAERLLERLQGRMLALQARDLNRSLYLLAHRSGLQVLTQSDEPAQATLSGSLASLSRLAGANTGRLPEGVALEGDIEIAEGFSQLIVLARPDLESLLSSAFGDALANTVGTGLRRAGTWIRRSLLSLGQDTSEYLRYETDLLPDRPEVTAWMDEVDRLRDDVARLAARVARLQDETTPSDPAP